MFSNPKKWIQMLFAIKSSLKFPALAMPNKVDRVMKDWWRMKSHQEYVNAFCFYFACLTTAWLHQLHFVCFWSRKTLHHNWNNSYGTWSRRISWFLTWRHDPFWNPDPRSISLGVVEAGILKLDLGVLKSHYDENCIFSIKAILKHKQVACMRRKMLFTIFKYLFLFQRYSSF